MNHLNQLIKNYVPQALRTELNPKEIRGKALVLRRLRHAALGVCTEVAELAGGLDAVNELEEISDACWYLAVVTNVLDKRRLKMLVAGHVVHHMGTPDKAANLLHLVRLSGDLSDYAKRWEFYKKEPDWTAVQRTVRELWMALMRSIVLRGGDIQAALDANIAKLRSRYPERFTCALAVKRNVQKERKVLEQHMKKAA